MAPQSDTDLLAHVNPLVATYPAPPSIQAEGLGRRFGPLEALRDVSFELPAGCVTVLLGANGAGKTTLLSLLATRLRPSSGRATVAGIDVQRNARAVRARIGVVGHRAMLYPDLSAEENLAYFARLHGVPFDHAACRDALDQVGLARHARERTRHLSRGMRQRLALARATLHQPSVLLLDEPFAGLDPAAAAAFEARVLQAARAGRAVLLATHDLGRARRLADRALVLRRGRLRWVGEVKGWSEAQWQQLYADVAVSRSAGADAKPGGDLAGRADQAQAAPATFAPSEAAASASVGAQTPMPFRPASAWTVALTVAARDVRTELRAREILPPTLVFALLAVVLLGQAAPGTASDLLRLAPGVLWVALLLGSTLGLSRTLAGEAEGGGLAGTLASPADRGAIFVGKWLASWGHAVLVGWLLLPVVIALYRLNPSLSGFLAAAAIVALGCAGWTAAGVLVSGAALTARAREMLVPVLLYPLALPLVLPAARATGAVLGVEAGFGAAPSTSGALLLIGAYALIYVVLGFLLFPFVADAA
jgi:heme exporter protein A